MEKSIAETLLPKFQHLEGIYFRRYESEVKRVFVGYTDVNLTSDFYNVQYLHNCKFPEHPLDKYRYTLIAKLSNGKFIDVKRIVIEEKFENLFIDAKLLDYID